MKKGISGLRNESSKTKRTGLFQRITAAFPLPLIIIYKKVSSTFLLNISLFWHINEGIEEIMADHVHQEMTRNWILVYLRLFLLIVIKDVFLSLVSCLNKSKNLMDRTLTPGDLTADRPGGAVLRTEGPEKRSTPIIDPFLGDGAERTPVSLGNTLLFSALMSGRGSRISFSNSLSFL